MRTKAFFNFELIIRKLKRQRKIGRWGLLRNVQTAFDLAFPKRSVEIGAPNRKKTAVEIASVNPEVRLRIRLADSGGQYFVDRHEDGWQCESGSYGPRAVIYRILGIYAEALIAQRSASRTARTKSTGVIELNGVPVPRLVDLDSAQSLSDSDSSKRARLTEILAPLHHPDGVVLDLDVERTFVNRDQYVRYGHPRMGLVLTPPGKSPPKEVNRVCHNALLDSPEFRSSLAYCKGLFCANDEHRDWLKSRVPIPVNILPTVASEHAASGVARDAIINCFVKSENYQRLYPREVEPFVIFAHARSGSTTLLNIANSHMDITCINEPFNAKREKWSNRNYLAEVTDQSSLNRCLSEIFCTATGFKHLAGQLDAAYTAQLLKLAKRVIFLNRKNILQAAVSNAISRQTEHWGVNHDLVDEHAFEPIRVDVLSKRIKDLRDSINDSRRNMESLGVEYLEVTYEELFGMHLPVENKLAKCDGIFRFLGARDPVGAAFSEIRSLLNPDLRKLNTEDTYRRIPNIDEIAQALQNEDNGFLFGADAS